MGGAGQASTAFEGPQPPGCLEGSQVKSQLSFVVYPAIIALSLAAAVSAHAESPTVDDSVSQQWSQTKTRDQVQAELLQARADGTTKVWSISYNPLRQAKSLKSRDEVRGEVVVQRASESANPLVGEDSGSFYLAQQTPARDAAPVLAKTSR
jgi:hypothetical protein